MTQSIAKKWRVLGVVGALCVPALVTAALSVPYSFKAGDPIKASQVNANFEALRAQLDALSSGTPPRQVVGTLTLPGVISAGPIRGFSVAVDVPFVAGGSGQGTGKPALSEVQVVRDAGADTPPLDLLLNQQKHVATADIVLGNLTVHLSDVLVGRVSVSGAQEGYAQEAISLFFSSIQWTWQVAKGTPTVVTFDVAKAVASGGGTPPASLAYFPPGVAADTSYVPITGYSHDMGCATPPCKVAHGALTVQRLVSAETLDILGTALTSKHTPKIDLTWFTSATAASHSISLTEFLISHVAITANDDGTLSESDSFNYSTISWTAGKVQTGWDAVKGAAL